jgi:hypothetical protein
MSYKRTALILAGRSVPISLLAFSQESLNKIESTGLTEERHEQLHSGADGENSAIDESPDRERRREGPVKPEKQNRFAATAVGCVSALFQVSQRGAEI